MDSYIGDDLYTIFENNCKIKFLCDIKKTLLYYLVDYIIENGNKKYKNFCIEQYYMNSFIVTDIISIYDKLNITHNTIGSLQHAILSIHGINFVSSYMKDPIFINLVDILNSNDNSAINITALTLINTIDNIILTLKKYNSNIAIDSLIIPKNNIYGNDDKPIVNLGRRRSKTL